jgi:CBS domain-containing protein
LTLLQTHPRSRTTAVPGTTAETVATAASGPQVWDDMTVEVALCVMAAARTGHLVVCDADGRRTGLVTRARLAAVRDGSGYTDRVRLRDVAQAFAPPVSAPGGRSGSLRVAAGA